MPSGPAAAPARSSPLSSLDPQFVGEYALFGRLDQGGWGRVYLARSTADTLIALRLLDRDWASTPEGRSSLAQLMIAARRTNRLSCTARLYDLQPEHAMPHLAGEYIDGRLLRDVVTAQGPFSATAWEALATETLAGLAAIHAEGAVHRSFNPATVVLGRDGVRMIDLGLIPLTAGASDQEPPEPVIWQHAAPEVLLGESVGPEADVFGWASTIVFAASGAGPFPAPGPADYLERLQSGAPVLDGVPVSWQPLVQACLAPDPRRRPTADHVRDVLPTPDGLGSASSAALPAATGGRAPARAPFVIPPPFGVPTSFDGPAAQPEVTSPPLGPPSRIAAGPPPPLPPSADRSEPLMDPLPAAPRVRPELRYGRLGALRNLILRRPVVAVIAAAALLGLIAGGTLALTSGGGDRIAGAAAVSSVAPECPNLPASASASLVSEPTEGCYGYADTGHGFGTDPLAIALQSAIFAANRPPAPGDLTVIWVGPLTCPGYHPDGACSDGRVYDAERQELQGLLLAQHRTDLGGHLHVIIANAGPNFDHADRVAQLIASHRAAFGRAVVVGLGEGRMITQRASTILLDARLPVVAPNLTADQDLPGMPFLTRPGFLQLSPPNREWAQAAVSFVAAHTPRGAHRAVIVFHRATPGDEYTESYARDVLGVAAANPATSATTPQLVTSLSSIPMSICRDAPTGATPAALVFADRWTTFKDFVETITTKCGPHGAAMLIGSDSVDRFMTNDAARAAASAPWPMAYFRKGKQCTDLQQAAATPHGEAAALLAAARAQLGTCMTLANGSVAQIGDRVQEFWDAIALAERTVPTPLAQATSGRVQDMTLPAAGGALVVRNGQVTVRPVPSSALCVLSVDLSKGSGRSAANCDGAYGAPVR
jgi:serine/threonine protein kinase